MGGASKNADEDSFFNQKTPSTTEKRILDQNSLLPCITRAVQPLLLLFHLCKIYLLLKVVENIEIFRRSHSKQKTLFIFRSLFDSSTVIHTQSFNESIGIWIVSVNESNKLHDGSTLSTEQCPSLRHSASSLKQSAPSYNNISFYCNIFCVMFALLLIRRL